MCREAEILRKKNRELEEEKGRTQSKFQNAKLQISTFENDSKELTLKINTLVNDNEDLQNRIKELELEKSSLLDQLRVKSREYDKAILDSKRALKSAEASKKATVSALQRVEMAEADREDAYERMVAAQESREKAERKADAGVQEKDAFLAYKSDVENLSLQNDSIREEIKKEIQLRKTAEKLYSEAIAERDEALTERSKSQVTAEKAIIEKEDAVLSLHKLQESFQHLEEEVKKLKADKIATESEKENALGRIASHEASMNEIRVALEAMSQKYNETLNKLEAVEKERDDVRDSLQSAESSGKLAESKNNAVMSELRGQIKLLASERENMGERFDMAYLSAFQELLACKIKLIAVQSDVDEVPNSYLKTIADLQKTVHERDNALAQASDRLSSMREKLGEVAMGQSALEQENEFWRQRTNTAEQEMDRILSELEIAREELHTASNRAKEMASLQEEIAKLQEQLQSAEEKFEKVDHKKDDTMTKDLAAKADHYESQLAKATEQANRDKTVLFALIQKVETTEMELKKAQKAQCDLKELNDVLLGRIRELETASNPQMQPKPQNR